MHSPISESMPEPPKNEWFRPPPGYVPLWHVLGGYLMGALTGFLLGWTAI